MERSFSSRCKSLKIPHRTSRQPASRRSFCKRCVMPKPRPPYLHRQMTRHGEVTWYVRKGHGARIRIKAEYGSEEFWMQYRAALEGAPAVSTTIAKAHTLAWGLDRYRSSSAWAA